MVDQRGRAALLGLLPDVEPEVERNFMSAAISSSVCAFARRAHDEAAGHARRGGSAGCASAACRSSSEAILRDTPMCSTVGM